MVKPESEPKGELDLMEDFKQKWNEIRKDAEQGNYWERHGVMKESLMSVAMRHQFLIDKILEQDPKTALDIGTGRGIIPIVLSQQGVSVVAIDKNPGYIAVGQESNRFLGGSVTFVKGDVFRHVFTRRFDVVFSQGFIHHFHDQRLFQLLKKFVYLAEWNVHSVPSEKHPAPPSRTPYFQEDEVEKFKSKKEWDWELKSLNPTIEYYSHDLEGEYSGKLYEDVSLCILIQGKYHLEH